MIDDWLIAFGFLCIGGLFVTTALLELLENIQRVVGVVMRLGEIPEI